MSKKTNTQSKTEETANTAIVSVEQPGALVVASDDYGQYEDAGFEDVREEDLAPPLLLLAQSNTPEVKRGEAKIGDLICRVLKRVWTLPVQFIPLSVTLRFVVWKPLNQGGGFVASLEPDHPEVVDAMRRQPMGKKQLTRVVEGNRVTYDLVETQYLSLLLLDPESDTWVPMILPLTSTKLTPFRQFLRQAKNLRGKRPDGSSYTFPLFAHRWQLGHRTQVKHNQESEVVTFELAGANAAEARVSATSPEFLMAAAYHKRMRDGGIVIDDAQQAQDAGDDGYGEDRGYSQGNGYGQASNAPF